VGGRLLVDSRQRLDRAGGFEFLKSQGLVKQVGAEGRCNSVSWNRLGYYLEVGSLGWAWVGREATSRAK